MSEPQVIRESAMRFAFLSVTNTDTPSSAVTMFKYALCSMLFALCGILRLGHASDCIS